jgi:NADH dehydrogenase [ubiquinone] 1 alpha subcomplex assembly factor 3
MKPETDKYFDRQMKVYGLNNGQFLINHYWIDGSVIIFPHRFYMWNVIEAEEIKPHTLEVMNFVKPRPDYLIVGTGETNVMLDQSFYDHFKRMGISVDTCPTFEACSTFNMCVEDKYNVACALLQPRFKTDKDGKDPFPPKYSDEKEQEISGFIGLGNESFGKEKVKERELKKLLGKKE